LEGQKGQEKNMDTAQFRQNFTEFSDAARYPAAMIAAWSAQVERITSVDIYGDSYAFAVELGTAHFLTTAAMNVSASMNGGAPGSVGGVVSSKSVGDVSVAYDASIGTMGDDAGQWNATTYGRQYLTLARLFGAGCVQL
jgi:hypothetical protein